MPVYRLDKDSNKKLHDYRVIVNYTDSFGRYKKKEKVIHGALLKDANKLLAQMQIEMENNPNEPNKLTFDILISKFLEFKKENIRLSSFESEEKKIKRFIVPFFGKMKVENVKQATIESFKSFLNKCTNVRTNSPLSIKYKQNVYKSLVSIINYGIKYLDVSKNIASNVGNFTNKDFSKKHDLHYLTLDQFNKFSSAMYDWCQDDDSNYMHWSLYVFFNLIFYCGFRKSEAYALRWNRYKDGVLQVRTGITEKVKGHPWIEDNPKNPSSVRDVPVCNKLKDILEEHYERTKNITGFKDDWFICNGPTPLKDETVSKTKFYFCKQCDLPSIRIHDFRHSFATLLVNQNINIKVISALMGHATVEQTWNTYSHLYPSASNEAISKINELTKNIGK